MTREVLYQRGGEVVQLLATVGATAFEQTDDFGILQRSESRDYLILAAELVLVGGPSEPIAGDVIREPFGDVDHVYEVSSPPGEPQFRYSDPNKITLRIHTKFIGEEPRQ